MQQGSSHLQQYTLKNLEQKMFKNNRQLYIRICNMKSVSYSWSFNSDLTQLAKILVWGDRHNSDFFDYICQVRMFDTMHQLFSNSKHKQVVNGVIGFYSLLLVNINNTMIMNYILSHPCIMSMQMIKFGTIHHEVAQYYINFLRSLTMKINDQTLHLFVNKKYAQFPLLTQIIRFYNHPQKLVRITCRNIILALARIKNDKIQQYMIGFPFCTYLAHQCNLIVQYWNIMHNILDNSLDDDNTYEIQHIDTVIEDHQEILLFLDDLLNATQFRQYTKTIASKFIDAFINYNLSYLFRSILNKDKNTNSLFQLKTVLFIVILLIKNMTNKNILNTIVMFLFSPYYSKKLIDHFVNPIDRLLSYNKVWKFKGFWDNYQMKINQYCFFTYYKNKLSSTDIKTIKPNLTFQNMAVFGVDTNFYNQQMSKIENIFGISMMNQTSNNKTKGSQIMLEMMSQIKSKIQLSNHMKINPIRQKLLQILQIKETNSFQSLKDCLLMQILHLLQIITKNNYVNKQVLEICGLNICKNNMMNKESLQNIKWIFQCCCFLFQIDPPKFRICTYLQAYDLIIYFSQFYKIKQCPLNNNITSLLKKALYKSIRRINPYLYESKQCQKSTKMYLIAEKQNKKKRIKTIYTYGLVSNKDYKPVNKDVNSLYEQPMRTFQQQIGRDFWIYILIRDCYDILRDGNGPSPEYQMESEMSNDSKKFQINKNYQLIAEQVYQALYCELTKQQTSQCQIILLDSTIVLGLNKVVQYKQIYHECAIIDNKSDSRKLILKINQLSLSIKLDSTLTIMNFKQNFERRKSQMLKYSLAKLVKEVQYYASVC